MCGFKANLLLAAAAFIAAAGGIALPAAAGEPCCCPNCVIIDPACDSSGYEGLCGGGGNSFTDCCTPCNTIQVLGDKASCCSGNNINTSRSGFCAGNPCPYEGQACSDCDEE